MIVCVQELGMTTERIEVRLEPEQRRRLVEMAERDRATISEMIRRMIDETYDAQMHERRMAAAKRLVTREIEDVPDPDELSRQLAEAHGPVELYQ